MNDLKDFYRNITYCEEYDENSFIGKWLDYGEWADDEYWKLEQSLLKIAKILQSTICRQSYRREVRLWIIMYRNPR